MAGLQSANPVDTPLKVNVKYHRDDGDLLLDPLLYRQLVGSLNYLTITRPNISFAVQQLVNSCILRAIFTWQQFAVLFVT